MDSNDDIPNSDQQKDPKDTSNYVSSLRNPSFGQGSVDGMPMNESINDVEMASEEGV